jgi:DeoR family transcriptional regulator, aga operon transcriptional repressor
VFRAMTRRARKVVIVADSSKVGMTSPAVICPVSDIDVLITDDGVSDEAVEAFRRCEVEVVVV